MQTQARLFLTTFVLTQVTQPAARPNFFLDQEYFVERTTHELRFATSEDNRWQAIFGVFNDDTETDRTWRLELPSDYRPRLCTQQPNSWRNQL